MKVIGIVNRVGIAPASNKPNSDSERSSCSSGWSSASSIHSNYTKSPEPKVPEQAAQKLQQTVPASSVTKKVIIAVTITCGIILLIGGVLGGTLSHRGNEPTTEPTETTPSTSNSTITSELTKSTTSINTTTTTLK